jgi:hypothetical protein
VLTRILKDTYIFIFKKLFTSNHDLTKEILGLVEGVTSIMMLRILNKNSNLATTLWNAGKYGVSDEELEKFKKDIPKQLDNLIQFQYDYEGLKPYTPLSILRWAKSLYDLSS